MNMEMGNSLSMHNQDEFEQLVLDLSKTVFNFGLALDYFDNHFKADKNFLEDENIQNSLRLVDDCRSNLEMHVFDIMGLYKCLQKGVDFNANTEENLTDGDALAI